MFPELRAYLDDAFEHARTVAEFVFAGCRSTKGEPAVRILGNAGVTPGPRLYQNLRSSRQTELGERDRAAGRFTSRYQ